ncbi:hypothetical protein PoB_004238900 [Plakobranchus ocellatus]|uniref:Uncharacterized protein n=1 Tax=Plakobranchus ocellatus TaxID=259542 RepID=A0AAV4BC00_9GAST|nr:hypothetical protein PoB_004238900 [Plakobranchus ocellatus]
MGSDPSGVVGVSFGERTIHVICEVRLSVKWTVRHDSQAFRQTDCLIPNSDSRQQSQEASPRHSVTDHISQRTQSDSEGDTPPNSAIRSVGGTVASRFALRSAGIHLSRVRAPLLAFRPDGGPESPRSPWF